MARRTEMSAAQGGRRRSTRGVIAAIAIGLVIGAAGTGPLATTGAGAAANNSGGVITMPYDLAAYGGIKFDPTTPSNPNDWYMQRWLYDSLLRQNADGSYAPGLAKSATSPDPQTIVIELKPGIKFSDGTPLDAEAVKFSIERTLAANNVGSDRAELREISAITVDSPTKLTISLKTPIAGQFYNLLAHGETYVVSPTAVKSGTPLDQKPVGAGPFLLDSFTPENKAVFKRNPNYFEKNKIKLSGIELIQASAQDPQAPINAMLDNITNVAQLNGVAGTEALTGAGITVDLKASDTTAIYGALCKSKPPFDNVKVPQALNYAVDRDQINQLVYQGKSQPMWAHWTKQNALFNPKLDNYYKRNVKKAKKLLKEAGAEGLTFDMYSNLTADTTRVAEVIKEQLAEAGITVKIKLVDSATLISDGNGKSFEMISYQWSGRPDPDGNTYQFFHTTPGTSLNWSGISNPQMDALLDKSREISSQAERTKLFGQLTRLLQDELPMVFIVHPIEPKAFSPRVQNYDPIPDGMMRFKDVWLK